MNYSTLNPQDIVNIPLSTLIIEQVSAFSGGVIGGLIIGTLIGFSIASLLFGLPEFIGIIIKRILKKNE